jgi:hypothetical protein
MYSASLGEGFVALIGQLYYVEAQARRDGVDAPALGRRRQALSVPVLQDEALLLANLHAVLPKSLLGEALHSLASQRSKLKRYIEGSRYSIDNNTQKNAIRSFRVGRCNRLFPDPVADAHASENLYSLLQTCKFNGTSTATASCAHCSSHCPTRRPPTTTPSCCLGVSCARASDHRQNGRPRINADRPRHRSTS